MTVVASGPRSPWFALVIPVGMLLLAAAIWLVIGFQPPMPIPVIAGLGLLILTLAYPAVLGSLTPAETSIRVAGALLFATPIAVFMVSSSVITTITQPGVYWPDPVAFVLLAIVTLGVFFAATVASAHARAGRPIRGAILAVLIQFTILATIYFRLLLIF